MTFSYNNTVPATNNNPSNDQPLMLINAQSTASILAVNHIGFNQAGGGQHTTIQFDQSASYVPVPPVSPPQLFTNTVAGLPQLFYYSGNLAASADQYDQAANFSTFLLGGLILKGGTITVTANPQTITYSTLAPALGAFINDTLSVILYPANAAAASRTPYISAMTATTFDVTSGFIGVSATYNFIAIGN